jgi:restriction system protein
VANLRPGLLASGRSHVLEQNALEDLGSPLISRSFGRLETLPPRPTPNGSEDMADVTFCGDCRTIIDEYRYVDPEKRVPCPKCGSTARTYSVENSMTSGFETRIDAQVIFSRSNLFMQTVIVPGAQTSEGKLIEAVAAPWFDIIALLQRDPSIAYQLSWDQWEEIIAGAYKKAGFDEVTLTHRSGDHGRDVIAIKKGLGSVRVIDSVKAYKPSHLVKANDVRALIGVLQTDGAPKGFVTTTSDFAPRIKQDPTITPWIPSRLELINGEMLLTRLAELAQERNT